MSDVTILAEEARAAAMILRVAALKDAGFKGKDGTHYRAGDLANLLDPPPADISVTDAEHLSRAEARLDTINPVISIDPAMGVNITEQIKTLFQVVGKSPAHGAAVVECECLVCAAVHSIADTILRESAPPAPSLRDEMDQAIRYHDPIVENQIDAVLAVVRRHVEALDRHGFVPGKPHMWASHPKGVWLDREDLLRLLGGDDD